MVRAKRYLIANRLNAKKSTGPKAFAGKFRSGKIERKFLERTVIKFLERAL